MRLTGKRAFVWQQVSAAYLALYTPYLVWLSLTQSIGSQADLFSPTLLVPSLIALILLLIHAWVGLRDVMIDYLPRPYLSGLLRGLLVLLILIGLNLVWLLTQGLTL
jgi:succinate dehydrogenase / fumarate reductase membrane anchor subunit